MGNTYSCASQAAFLLSAAEQGDLQTARRILARKPSLALSYGFVDKTSPLMVAAGCGHLAVLQVLLETAVAKEGPDRAKKHCINHTNVKGQSALMLACGNGYASCVEYLVNNGANPFLFDLQRRNTCLHLAASHCRNECIYKLLGSSVTTPVEGANAASVAEVSCTDIHNQYNVRYVDLHNGWGMTALHIAVMKSSTATVRALLRRGARLDSRTMAPLASCPCPTLCHPGSTALHLAAQNSDMAMVRTLLEFQMSRGGPDLRRLTNDVGQKPVDLLRPGRTHLLRSLLDETMPYRSGHVTRSRSDWQAGTAQQVLTSSLQRLQLILSLEVLALEKKSEPTTGVKEKLGEEQIAAMVEGPSCGDLPMWKAQEAGEAPRGDAQGVASKEALLLIEAATPSPDSTPYGDGARSCLHPVVRTNTSRVLSRKDELSELTALVGRVTGRLKELGEQGRENIEVEQLEGLWINRFFRGGAAGLLQGTVDQLLTSHIPPSTMATVIHATHSLAACSSLNPQGQDQGGKVDGSEQDYCLALLRNALEALERGLLSASEMIKRQDRVTLSSEGLARDVGEEQNVRHPTPGDVDARVGPLPEDVVPLLPPRAPGRRLSARGEAPPAWYSPRSMRPAPLLSPPQGPHSWGSERLPSPFYLDRWSQPQDHADGWGQEQLEIYRGLRPSRSGQRRGRHRSSRTSSRATNRHMRTQEVPMTSPWYLQTNGERDVRAPRDALVNPSRSPWRLRTPTQGRQGEVQQDRAGGSRREARPRADSTGGSNSTDSNTTMRHGTTREEGRPMATATNQEPPPRPRLGPSQLRAPVARDAVHVGRVGMDVQPTTQSGPCALSPAAIVTGDEGRWKDPLVRTRNVVSESCLVDEYDTDGEDGSMVCSICMDRQVGVRMASCEHTICLQCAYQVCAKGRTRPLCPYCRQEISGFALTREEVKVDQVQ